MIKIKIKPITHEGFMHIYMCMEYVLTFKFCSFETMWTGFEIKPFCCENIHKHETIKCINTVKKLWNTQYYMI